MNENYEFCRNLEKELNERIKDNDIDGKTYMQILAYCGLDVDKANKYYEQLEENGILYLSDVVPNSVSKDFGWLLPEVHNEN